MIVCFAGDIWDGNPHSRHHLMRRLAGEFSILFVEGIPMRSFSRPGAVEGRRILRKVAAGSSLQPVAPGLHVLRPWPIPPAGPVGRQIQLEVVRQQVLRAISRLDLLGPRISWFSLPNVAPLRGRLGERGAIFYYQDRYDAFSHVDGTRLRCAMRHLARECQVVVATSASLARDLAEAGGQPLTLPHGVELDHFAADTVVPDDVRDLERPLVGCVGLIDDYVSVEALLATADALRRGTVVLVGGANTDVRELRDHPRIVLLGRRDYQSIPSYVHSFDCCLIPFRINRLTVAVNPIKLREYLAAGRPVVSTPLPEVRPYAEVVRLAEHPHDFASAVCDVLASTDDQAERAARHARVSGESWDAVAERVAALLRPMVA